MIRTTTVVLYNKRYKLHNLIIMSSMFTKPIYLYTLFIITETSKSVDIQLYIIYYIVYTNLLFHYFERSMTILNRFTVDFINYE